MFRSKGTINPPRKVLLFLQVSIKYLQRLASRFDAFRCRKNNISVDSEAYKAWHDQHAPSLLLNGPTSSNTELAQVTHDDNDVSHATINGRELNSQTSNSEPPAPYPTSFSQIVELITTGQPIPGIKQVSDTVLEGHATQATNPRRRKPWELGYNVEGESISTPVND